MKVAVLNWNDVVPDLKKYFEVIEGERFLEADALIAAHDANSTQAAMAKTAREYGIPVFTLQHGRFAASDYAYNGKSPMGDYFLAWGDTDVEMAIIGGWKKEQVMKVGAPPLMDWVKPKPDGKTVVFVPAHIEALQSQNAINDNEALRIWEKLRGMEGIKPVIKLLAGEHPEDAIHGDKFITNRNESGHIRKIYRWLLKNASCVVSQAEGTFELLAYSMDIPVIRIDNYYHTPDKFHTASCLIKSVDELENAVRHALAHPKELSGLRRQIMEDDGGGLPCRSVLNIVAAINQKVIAKIARASMTDKCGVVTYFLKEMSPENYYRIVMPLDKMAEHDPDIAVKKIVKGEDSAKIANGLITDVLTFPPIGEPRMIDVAYRLKELGKKVVMDMDDNVFNISPFSPKYFRYGSKNVKAGDVVLWEGKKNIDFFSNQVYVENLMTGLELADLVTVPTQALADVYCKYSSNVKILPTCIDMKVWKKLPLLKEDTIRIGWHGGTESVEDVDILRDAMKEVMGKYPNIVFVILGARFSGTFKDLPQDRIEGHPMVSADALPYRLAGLNLDIGLIPNKETEHSLFRTPVKWLEYASLEIPTVCSLTYPYMDIDENAGVFVEDNDKEGWVEGISVMIEDTILRAKVAGTARRLVKDKFDINTQYKNWSAVYKGLYS